MSDGLKVDERYTIAIIIESELRFHSQIEAIDYSMQ